MSDISSGSPFCPWCFVSTNGEKILNLNPNKFVTRATAVNSVTKTATGPFDKDGWICILCLVRLPSESWAQAMQWAAAFCGCREEDVAESISKAIKNI